MVLPVDVLDTVDMNVKTSIASSDETLSEYERIRMQKIERNNAKLRSLGLITRREEEQSNARATKSRRESKGQSKAKPAPVRKSLRSMKTINASKTCAILPSTAKGARSSLRLKGLPPPIRSSSNDENVKNHRNTGAEPILSRTKPFAITSQNMTSSNRTATYEHCAMRIRTMSHAQLRHRILVVERAFGQHCLLKLQIMVQCFRDHDLYDLAQMAESALHRLSEP